MADYRDTICAYQARNAPTRAKRTALVQTNENSGRAKGAAKGSCGETVVQKGVFGESVSSLPP